MSIRILTPGHLYVLPNFERVGAQGQLLQFIEKEPDPNAPSELITVADGTTNEAVLSMLIDRLQFLQSKFPCRENAIVITKLEESLMWLKKRTEDQGNRKPLR